jgi:hypothetical protein
MAPIAPLGRTRAIQLVTEGTLPVTFGSPHPSVMVLKQEGMFRIRELVVDEVAARDAAEASRRARTPSWMPEHYYSLGRPTGKVFAEAASRTELLELMATMPWPAEW